jgi:hypothetical protein
VKDTEERSGWGEEGGGQERRKCHLEGGALGMARAKGICREFIKMYDSRTHSEGEKGLRAQSIYISCLKNCENVTEYAKIRNFCIRQQISTFFF